MSLKTKIITLAILVLLLVSLKFGYAWLERQCARCYKPEIENGVPQITKDYTNLKLVYTRNNGSLPPDYHRDYTYTITTNEKGEVSGDYVVKDYEKVLEQKPLAISKKQLEKLIAAVKKIDPKTNDNTNSGCTGGTYESVKISQNTKSLLQISSYSCAGKSTNESLEEFSTIVEKILADK